MPVDFLSSFASCARMTQSWTESRRAPYEESTSGVHFALTGSSSRRLKQKGINLLGFTLPGYHKSLKQQQRQASKFYFFDLGIKTALERRLNLQVEKQTSEFGQAFEHFVVCEAHRLNSLFKKDYEFSYLRTKDNLEVDLVIERPGEKTAFVEIKSKSKVDERDCRHLERLQKDVKAAEWFLLSLDPVPKKIGAVKAMPWQQGLIELGL